MNTISKAAARNRETVEAFLAGTHSPNIDDVRVIDRTVSPAIVCHGFPGGNPTDRESYKNFFRVFRQSFSGMTFDVDALVADDEFVAARWRVGARHTGDFAGVAADGRRVDFGGLVLYRMEDGLIAETWLQIDELGLLGQIGALPALAA